MKAQRLSQFLALRDGVKTRTNKQFTELQKTVANRPLFDGVRKTYLKKDEEGEDYPDQAVLVRSNVKDVLSQLQEILTSQFDVEATVDTGNCAARANVEVDGVVLLENVPVTTLLGLEKDLKQVREFVNNLPVLDPAYTWSADQSSGLWKTGELRTNRTAKVQKPIVLYQATDKHPAQTQLITNDEVVGEWSTVQSSGAVTAGEKAVLLSKCDRLVDAVKVAREEANSTKTSEVHIGAKICNFIFG